MKNVAFIGIATPIVLGIFFLQNTKDNWSSYTNEGHIFHDVHNG